MTSVETRHHINDDAIKQIREGMTAKEVEPLLGVPPGDYPTKPDDYLCLPAPPYRPWRYKHDAKIWASDEAKVRIHFDDFDRMEGVFQDWRFQKESFWDKIRRWLKQLVP
jgi:hypothetical protein